MCVYDLCVCARTCMFVYVCQCVCVCVRVWKSSLAFFSGATMVDCLLAPLQSAIKTNPNFCDTSTKSLQCCVSELNKRGNFSI